MACKRSAVRSRLAPPISQSYPFRALTNISPRTADLRSATDSRPTEGRPDLSRLAPPISQSYQFRAQTNTSQRTAAPRLTTDGRLDQSCAAPFCDSYQKRELETFERSVKLRSLLGEFQPLFTSRKLASWLMLIRQCSLVLIHPLLTM